MKGYMRDYRKLEREILRKARIQLGLSTRVKKPQKKRKRRKQ